MRKLTKLGGVLLLVGALVAQWQPAQADIPYVQGPATVLSTTVGAGSTAVIPGLVGQTSCSYNATGTGTLVAEVSQDGTTWTAANIYTPTATSPVTSVSAPSIGTVPVSVFANFRIRMTATGPSTVRIACGQGGPYVIAGGGGGGGGVTNVTGSAPITSSGGATPDIACVTCVTGLAAGNQVLVGTGATPSVAVTTAPTFLNITDSALTSGDCLQASTAGLLTTTAAACGTVTGLTAGLNMVVGTGATPSVATTGAPTFTTVTDSALTSGNCVQAGTAGILTDIGAPCGTGNGTVTGLVAGNQMLVGTGPTPSVAVTSAPVFANITDSALTSGNCVQASTAGLLTTTGSACGAGGGGVPAYDTSGASIASYHITFLTGVTSNSKIACGNPGIGSVYCATITLTGAAQFSSGGAISTPPSFTCGSGWIWQLASSGYFVTTFDTSGLNEMYVTFAASTPNTIFVGSDLNAGTAFSIACEGS